MAKPGDVENKAKPADADKTQQADADNKANPACGNSKIRMVLRKAGSYTGPFMPVEVWSSQLIAPLTPPASQIS